MSYFRKCTNRATRHAADGKFLFEHFSSSPCHAIILDRPNAYPCPLRQFRSRLDQYLKEASKGDTKIGQNPSMISPPSATCSPMTAWLAFNPALELVLDYLERACRAPEYPCHPLPIWLFLFSSICFSPLSFFLSFFLSCCLTRSEATAKPSVELLNKAAHTLNILGFDLEITFVRGDLVFHPIQLPHPSGRPIRGIVREGTDHQIYTLALTGYTWGIRHIRKEKEFRYLCCTEEGVEPADDAQPTFPWHLFTGPKDIILQVLNDLGP